VRREIGRQLDGVSGVPMEIDGSIARNHRQPSAERRRLPEPGEPVPGRQKHVLDQVLDVNPRDPRQQQAMDHPCVALVQLAKRRLVASLRRRRQLPVVGRVGGSKPDAGHRARAGRVRQGRGLQPSGSGVH
jgi:hypothetical protein